MIAAILYGLFVCFIAVLLLLGIMLVFSRPWLLWIIIPVIILFIITIVYGMKKDAPTTQNTTPQNDNDSTSAETAHNISDGEKTINTKLVGVTHLKNKDFEIQDILPELHAGDQLAFILDFGNAYDDNAIAVYCGSSHIGYLNRKLAAKIAGHIDWGDRITGSITEITGGGELYYGCNITLTIH